MLLVFIFSTACLLGHTVLCLNEAAAHLQRGLHAVTLVAGLTQEVVGPVPRQLKHVQAGEQAPAGGTPVLLNGVPAKGAALSQSAASRCALFWLGCLQQQGATG